MKKNAIAVQLFKKKIQHVADNFRCDRKSVRTGVQAVNDNFEYNKYDLYEILKELEDA